MTPEIIALWYAIIKMGISLGVDVYNIIKDAGFNEATTDELCAMVDKARGELRVPE